MTKKPITRTKAMTQAAKAARNALAVGRCDDALDAIAMYEYQRGARAEDLMGSSRAGWRDNWKLTTGVSLNLRSAFRDRCVKRKR